MHRAEPLECGGSAAAFDPSRIQKRDPQDFELPTLVQLACDKAEVSSAAFKIEEKSLRL
jgi:hypothetical protein